MISSPVLLSMSSIVGGHSSAVNGMLCSICLISLFVLSEPSIQSPQKQLGPFYQIPTSSIGWKQLNSPDGVLFTSRNSHASCVFKGKIWLTGGRSDLYTTFNLIDTHKRADVWCSIDGARWIKQTKLRGDFWAQNEDAKQPGPVAPWYGRYGHSLNAVDINGDTKPDILILMGGNSPEPSNDIWISEDGVTWVYSGHAPWTPRAWHATTIFRNQLWIAGGTPLNNDVWFLQSVEKIARRPPLTRSMYVNYTFSLTWNRANSPPWSPRAGMALMSHWYFNNTLKHHGNSTERLVMIGGFGGWPDGPLYDGMHARAEVWYSGPDGSNWTLATKNASFGQLAWFGAAVMHGEDPRLDPVASSGKVPPRVFVFGGGNVGYSTDSTRFINQIDGSLDGYWSRDMVNWVRINYMEGGGGEQQIKKLYSTKNVPLYSSSEWTRTTINSKPVYRGLWGHTLVSFNTSTGEEHPGSLIMIGGEYTDDGAKSNGIFASQNGLFCDLDGVPCSYRGHCGQAYQGCICDKSPSDEYCTSTTTSSTTRSWSFSLGFPLFLTVFSMGCQYQLMHWI